MSKDASAREVKQKNQQKDKLITGPSCCVCGSTIEVQSTYCGSFCLECLAEHIEDCGVCKNDFT